MGGQLSKQRNNQAADAKPAKRENPDNKKPSEMPASGIVGSPARQGFFNTIPTFFVKELLDVCKSFPCGKLSTSINVAIAREWLDFLSKVCLITASNKGMHATLTQQFYKPDSKKERLNYLLNATITGQPKRVLMLLKVDPLLFFKKDHEITDPSGRTWFNVSAADLISFLGDDDLLDKVHTFAGQLEPEDIRQEFFKQWHAHQSSKAHGGADIVMMRRDSEPKYAAIRQCKNTFNVYGEIMTTERELLTNPDGIVCRKSSDNKLHWYYANPDTKKLQPIEINALGKLENQEDQDLYDALCTRMQNMEPNTPTARRLSHDEHQLFERHAHIRDTKAPVKIHREGIHYRQNGIDYIDTHYDFNLLINAYLKCIRLYHVAEDKANRSQMKLLFNRADKAWRNLGREQRCMPLWLLQRYCEEGRTFWPLAEEYKKTKFIRNFKIYNYKTLPPVEEEVFDVKSGKFSKDFGSNVHSGFAIYKGRISPRCGPRKHRGRLAVDLIAVNQLIRDASNHINNFEPRMPAVGPGPNLASSFSHSF